MSHLDKYFSRMHPSLNRDPLPQNALSITTFDTGPHNPAVTYTIVIRDGTILISSAGSFLTTNLTISGLAGQLNKTNYGITATPLAFGNLSALSLIEGTYITPCVIPIFTSPLWHLTVSLLQTLEQAKSDWNQANFQWDMHTASGAWLDELGSLYGVVREPAEPDSLYSLRMFNFSLAPRLNNIAIQKILNDLGYMATVTDNYASSPITQLMLNSDFETASNSIQVFQDALTSYTGTAIPAPWSLVGGSWTFGTGGATSAAVDSVILAGNSLWVPLQGKPLTAQVTFTTPATLPAKPFSLRLHQDGANYYYVNSYQGYTYLSKVVGGVASNASNGPLALAVSTTYTATLMLDVSGALTTKIYSGPDTTGTLLQTLTTNDTTLTSGFLLGIGGDTGTIVKTAKVIAPWADVWTIGGDTRVAWALTKRAISRSYSPNAVGLAGVSGTVTSATVATSASATYTASGYMNTQGVVSSGAQITASIGGTIVTVTTQTGTSPTGRYSKSGSGAGATSYIKLVMSNTGIATFDSFQLEQGSTASTYLENDSTTQSITRNFSNAFDVNLTLSSGVPLVGGYVYSTDIIMDLLNKLRAGGVNVNILLQGLLSDSISISDTISKLPSSSKIWTVGSITVGQFNV